MTRIAPSVPVSTLMLPGNDDAANLARHMDENKDGRITVDEFASLKRTGSGYIYKNDVDAMEKVFVKALPKGTDTSSLKFTYKGPQRRADEETLGGRLFWRGSDLFENGNVLEKVAGVAVSISAIPVAMVEAVAGSIKERLSKD